MPTFMIITLGTGRGAKNGIAKSIRDNQPQALTTKFGEKQKTVLCVIDYVNKEKLTIP